MFCFNGCKEFLNKLYRENIDLETENRFLKRVNQEHFDETVRIKVLIEQISKSPCSKCVDPVKVAQAKKDIAKMKL